MFNIVAMENVDAIIYTNTIIKMLEDEKFFNHIDPFVEKDPLYDEILVIVNENIIKFEDPTLSVEQLDDAINKVRRKSIGETFEDLVDKGYIDMHGIDKNGDITYVINEKHKKNKKK